MSVWREINSCRLQEIIQQSPQEWIKLKFSGGDGRLSDRVTSKIQFGQIFIWISQMVLIHGQNWFKKNQHWQTVYIVFTWLKIGQINQLIKNTSRLKFIWVHSKIQIYQELYKQLTPLLYTQYLSKSTPKLLFGMDLAKCLFLSKRQSYLKRRPQICIKIYFFLKF